MTRLYKNNILIALYHDYHLFGYLKDLIPRLLADDYQVTLLTCDQSVVDKYSFFEQNPAFTLKYLRPLRGVIRFMDIALLRPFIWGFGWMWSFYMTRKFDVVILPRDTKPFQHMVGSWKPTLVCQPGLAKYDKLYLKYLYAEGFDFPVPKINTCFRRIDALCGYGYLATLRGSAMNKFYSVVGSDFKKFFIALGAIENHVSITGNPNYEGLSRYCPDAQEQAHLMENLGISAEDDVYIFFASQLFFTLDELRHLEELFTVFMAESAAPVFIIKTHPRMMEDAITSLKKWAELIKGVHVKIVVDLNGDENNARLILISNAVCVEGSNVAIIAAWLNKPLLILNLSNNQDKSIYSLYDGILTIDGDKDLSDAITGLKSEGFRNKILNHQDEMIAKLSKKLESPNQKIVEMLPYIINSNEEIDAVL